MLRFLDIFKKVENSVKFEKNSQNTELPKLKILVGPETRDGNISKPFSPHKTAFVVPS